ncbi:MAG: FtsX-like permease family protein [Treponema sp.]|nr:FtsX-like permease family protein [Treponema sp.]
MKEIFRLALRNLKEHKAKTIIIACFLIFGVAIVILGNSFLESVNRGLERDFRANYTGDIAISITPDKGDKIDIFGVQTTNFTGGIPQIPAIPDLEKVQKIVDETDGIKSQTKLISAMVMVAKGLEMDVSKLIDRDDLGFDDMPVSMLFAGEEESYWNTFQGIHFVEGRYPAPNTNEIMIDTRVKRAFESLYQEPLSIGDDILILGANTNGIVREGKLVGVFKPTNENSAMFQIIYCNPGLARSFADLTYASSFSQELPESVNLELSSMSEDDLFGSFDDDFDVFDGFDDIEEDDSFLATSTADYDSILGDTTLRDELNKTDDGAWHFILAKCSHPSQTEKIIKQIKARCEEENLNVQVIGWKDAAFSYSGTVEGIGIVFNILIIILAVVVFIIIMNTMTVSVIERTGEIGTMRAIGAEKKFVRRLFFTESVFLTLVSSVIGIILAFIIMAIFNRCNITITNSIAKMILGGGLLQFTPTVKIIVLTIIIALAGSIVSNLYPVSSALKITPLKALSKGSE